MPSFDSDSLDDWLRWQEKLHPKNIDLGLDRIKAVAERLNIYSTIRHSSKKDNPTIISVAGTNGKGTCVAALQALLLRTNASVGVFTSPHLIHYNERIVINDQAASDQQLIWAFKQIETARGEISLTYHEFSTLAAVLLFLQAEVQYWLLEVGLGGRLDTVNMFDADIAIVTSIDLDHQDWLGDSREKIAIEKAGIYRKGVPAICVDPVPPNTLIDYAENLEANLMLANKDINWQENGGVWSWSGRDLNGNSITFEGLPQTQFAKASLSAALQAVVLLPVKLQQQDVVEALAHIQLSGRCQRVQLNDREFIFDVAHNPAAAKFLANFLTQPWFHANSNISAQTVAVFAVMGDKDIREIVSPLSELIKHWHVAGLPDFPRAALVSDLTALFSELSLETTDYKTVCDAIAAAVAGTDSGDRIVVFGSFYTVAEALQLLNSD